MSAITTTTINHNCTVAQAFGAGSGPVATAKGSVTYDQYNSQYNLTPASSPASKTNAQLLITLVSGALTVDLTNLTDLATGAVVSGNGNKVVYIRIKNLGANPMTFVGGASNGYLLWGTGGSLQVPAGGEVSFFTNGNTVPTIGGTTKTIDITGTASQTAQITVITG